MPKSSPILPPYTPNLNGLDDATKSAILARECETLTDCYTCWTPRPAGGTDPVNLLSRFLSFCHPGKGIVFELYQDSLPQFFYGVKLALDRACWIKGLFDEVQSSGPAMHPWMLWCGANIPNCPEVMGIGTSDEHGQILHRKCIAINVPGPNDPWPPPQTFTDWTTAAAQGYPVMWSGSWNLSKSATAQANHIDIMPGVVRAAVFAADLDREFAWVKANQQKYQAPLEQIGSPAT